MIVTSHPGRKALLYFFVFSVYAVINYMRDHVLIPFAILETIIVAASSLVYFESKKKAVLFKSGNEGIFVLGAKEGFYDPDFIRYDQILSCEKVKRRIVITLTDGREVVLAGLRKHLDPVYGDIIRRTRG